MPIVNIIDKSIDPAGAISDVIRNDCGGIVVFIGTIRDTSEGKAVKQVEIEAYDEMAIEDLQKIVDEAYSKYKLGEIVVVHRIGVIEVGEIVVTIAVSAPHRKEAFEACREVIDRMKQTTPIWKQEFFEDGSKWAAGDSR